MSTTIEKTKVSAVLYDEIIEQAYIKKHGNFIFGFNEIIKTEILKKELILDIKTLDMPEKILFNGKEVFMISKVTGKEIK